MLVVQDGDEVLGIAPLWQGRSKIREVPVQRVEFILCPDTPAADFIVCPDRREEVLDALFGYLLSADFRDSWDVISLAQWPQDSPNFAASQQILKRLRIHYFDQTTSVTPVIALNGSWEEFLQTRSPKFRKTHRNVANRLGRLEGVEVHCHRRKAEDSLFEQILEVSSRGWKAAEGLAIGSLPATRRFFSALTETAAIRGWLMVWLLKVKDQPVAVEYDLADGKQVFALRADFDQSYKEYSPGSFLEFQIIKTLFDEGFSEYFTGPGLNAYKLHWTEVTCENKEVHIFNHNLKGRFLWRLERQIVPLLKKVKNGELVGTTSSDRA
ncbi:MAG: GNAT family N-acetyltransferase [Acidobacteriota bacterium]